jgi:hypothetical protein
MFTLRVLFTAITILAVTFSLFFVVYFLDKENVSAGHFTSGPFDWLLPDDPVTAQNFLGSVAEAVCGILAIFVTVVAIIVQLAAHRYTPKITDIFVNDRTNVSILSFLVVTAVYGIWMSSSIRAAHDPISGDVFFPRIGMSLFLAMASASFFLVVPYFYHVFNFLKPLNIIRKIKIQAVGYLNLAIAAADDQSNNHASRRMLQDGIITTIEHLSEIATGAVKRADRSLGLFCIQSLKEIMTGKELRTPRDPEMLSYLRVKNRLPLPWFETAKEHFREFNDEIVQLIGQKKYWLEKKILLEYTSLLTFSLHTDRKLVNAIAISTREIASDPLRGKDRIILDLTRSAFNAYLKHAIDKEDVLSTTDILYHYRLLAEQALESNDIDTVMEIAKSMVEYGRLSYEKNMPRVLETVAYDLRNLNEIAYSLFKTAPQTAVNEVFIHWLLDLLLTVDDFPARRKDEVTLLGVRASQVILASFYMLEMEREFNKKLIEKIKNDMKDEPQSRLFDLQKMILTCEAEWDPVIDANRPNERYVPHGYHVHIRDFIAGFFV